MTVAYLFDPVKQFVSRNGIPLAGGFLNVFIGESQEPANTYSDAAGTVMNPQNIPIDSAGRALGVFVDDSKLYTLKAYNSGGQLQFSIYPVAPAKGGTSGGDSYYYPGDEFIYIDQDAREISLQNTKPIRGDEETIQMEDTADAVILHVNPDIIGDEMHVAAGEHTSVDYDSDNNTYTVNAEYAGSDTVEIDSDGAVHGNYEGGYGIEIDGNVVKEKHHRLISTNAVQYTYCKVFEFTWKQAYGRGLCVFTATNHDGNYVTFVLQLTRTVDADYTIVRPYVVAASPSMVSGAFVERLEVHTSGDKSIGYLKLNGFVQSQFWLDWEGISEAGEVVFAPQLTNATEGELTWIRSVLNSDVFYPQTNADNKFQKKLTAGDSILIDSDNVISNCSPVKFSSVIGNPDLSYCSTNVAAQRNGNSLTYTEMSFVNQYNNTGSFVLIPYGLGEGYLYIADNYISVKTIDSPSVVSGSATDTSWTNTIYQTPVNLDWNFTLDAGKLLDINVNACVYQNSQTSTPLYRVELVDASKNVKTYFSWVPREMDAAETDPDRSTLNGRLVWKNSTSASVTLSLRISDNDQAPTGTTQLKSIRIDGFVR
jgi:hypothetical protein